MRICTLSLFQFSCNCLYGCSCLVALHMNSPPTILDCHLVQLWASFLYCLWCIASRGPIFIFFLLSNFIIVSLPIGSSCFYQPLWQSCSCTSYFNFATRWWNNWALCSGRFFTSSRIMQIIDLLLFLLCLQCLT